MNIPKEVKVGGYTYRVVWADKIALHNNNDGETNTSDQIIKLQSGQGKEHTEQVFIHELLHACFYQMGFDDEDKQTEEQLVTRLALVLYQVIKDNKFR